MPPEPFAFRKVLYLVEATGRRAASLDEFLRVITVVDPRSVSYHMHREFIAHKFVHPEWPNDFAYWVTRVVGDEMLGEQLANLVVFRFRSLESLRAEVARLIGEHLLAHPKAGMLRAPHGRDLHFCVARSVVMDGTEQARDLPELIAALPKVSASSLFFHLFETRFGDACGGARQNDFAEWVEKSLGLPELARKLANIDPYMLSLEESRARVISVIAHELASKHAEVR